MKTEPPVIILVRPQLAENIGAAARVMHNFGFRRLSLVCPAFSPAAAPARAMASGALAILEEAKEFPSLAAALKQTRYALAVTARRRDMNKPVYHPQPAASELAARAPDAALVFGPERSGLTNEEITLADAIITIPANPAFSSLNLAQAVAILCWCCREQTANHERLHPLAPRHELIGLFEHLETALDAASFLHPPEKRPVMVRNLRNILQRAQLSASEVRALRGVIAALEKQSPPRR